NRVQTKTDLARAERQGSKFGSSCWHCLSFLCRRQTAKRNRYLTKGVGTHAAKLTGLNGEAVEWTGEKRGLLSRHFHLLSIVSRMNLPNKVLTTSCSILSEAKWADL